MLKLRLELKYRILYNQSGLRILQNSSEYIAATADETITVKTVKVAMKGSRSDRDVREAEKWRWHMQYASKAAAANGLWQA